MRSVVRLARVVLVVVGLGAPALGASAQAELTGTYVSYVAVGPNGTVLRGVRSMMYSESGAAPFSCDLFGPGGPYEAFAIEATPAGGTATTLENGDSSAEMPTSAGPTVSGRTITWSGRWASAGATMSVAQVLSFNALDRHVEMRVTLTNTGTTTLNNIYYTRRGDPDHGQCSIGTAYETRDDVVRQPPVDTNALITSTAGSTTVVTLGLGAHDARARASGGYGTGSTQWASPTDPGGVSADDYIALVFYVPTLASGASTTLTFYYVWGSSSAAVTTRFDALRAPACAGEGTACTSAGVSGTCHIGACCTGCWDGVSCQSGTAASGCGVRGGSCTTCDDRNTCTTDTCTAGICGAVSAPAGTTCDDGLYCTTGDACAAGRCTGAPRTCNDGLTCTTDRCDEASASCAVTIASGCVIGGACVATDSANPSNACQACTPARSTTAWSPRPSGTACGAASCVGGTLTSAAACSASGSCVAGSASSCDSGRCATATMCAGGCTTDTECGAGMFCAAGGRCDVTRAGGEACDRSTMCASGDCARGVCCATAGGCTMPDTDAGIVPDVDSGTPVASDSGTSAGADSGTSGTTPSGRRRSGGCSVGATQSATPVAPIALATLALLWATRRRRSGR